jgi:hypothetical protein
LVLFGVVQGYLASLCSRDHSNPTHPDLFSIHFVRSYPSTGHFGRECLVAVEYINAGKCRHDQQGKIVLATGTWIPRDLPGKCFKDRIDEWHRRNPSQLAAGQLMYNVLLQSVAQDSPPPVIATRQTHANLFDAPAQTQPLSAEQWIASLERELFQLRNLRPRVGGRKEREPNVDIPEDEPRKKKPAMRPNVVIPRSNPNPHPTSPVSHTNPLCHMVRVNSIARV